MNTTVQKYEASLLEATAHQEPWSHDEDELLFDGSIEDVAYVLGRTTYAVGQRRYQVLQGAASRDKKPTAPASYHGWVYGMDENQNYRAQVVAP